MTNRLDIYIRHAESNANLSQSVYMSGRDDDIVLTERGINQAGILRQELHSFFEGGHLRNNFSKLYEVFSQATIGGVYTSESIRADHTARLVFPHPEAEIHRLPFLNEFLRLQNNPEVMERFSFDRWMEDLDYREVNGWKSFSEMCSESAEFVNRPCLGDEVNVFFTHHFRVASILHACSHSPTRASMKNYLHHPIPNCSAFAFYNNSLIWSC